MCKYRAIKLLHNKLLKSVNKMLRTRTQLHILYRKYPRIRNSSIKKSSKIFANESRTHNLKIRLLDRQHVEVPYIQQEKWEWLKISDRSVPFEPPVVFGIRRLSWYHYLADRVVSTRPSSTFLVPSRCIFTSVITANYRLVFFIEYRMWFVFISNASAVIKLKLFLIFNIVY